MSNYTENYQDDYSYTGDWPGYGDGYSTTPTLTLDPIDSSMEMGVLSLELSIELSPIDSSIEMGTLTLAFGAITISLAPVDSSMEVGVLEIDDLPPTAYLDPIDISMELGTLTLEVGPVTIELSPIDSSMEMGDLSIVGIYYITLESIDSSMEVGALQVDVGAITLTLAPIDSSIEMGSLTILPIYYITLSPIDSSIEMGSITIIRLPLTLSSRRVPVYRVVIAEINGAALEEVPAKNLAYSFALNNPGGCDFVLPLEHAKSVRSLLEPGQREIHIYRNEERIWGGYLWAVGISSTQPEIRIAGEGYLSRLDRRLIADELIYEDEDQFDIAWDLINYTQSEADGALGFTRFSTTPSGVLRTRKFRSWERHNILDALQDLTEVYNGFDIEITPNKEFKHHYPYKGNDDGVVFELGKNIGSIAYDVDATRTVSELHGMGAGGDRNRCIAVVTHTETQTDFGLLQSTEDFSNVRRYDTLVDRTTEALRVRKGVRVLPQITVVTEDPAFGSFSVGDIVRVRAFKGYIDLDRQYRIGTQLVQVSDEGYESNQLFMNELVDV